METTEQELSFGTKINGIFCFIVGDISFLSFDRGFISPTVELETRIRNDNRNIKQPTTFCLMEIDIVVP